MDLAAKLQMKPGQTIDVLGDPSSVAADLPASSGPGDAAALLVFVMDRCVLEEQRALIVAAAERGRLTWVSYPKAGQLSTDLNRDSLAALLEESGIEPVRQIALDAVWSALRFRPAWNEGSQIWR